MNLPPAGLLVPVLLVLLSGTPAGAAEIATSIALGEPAFHEPAIHRLAGEEPRFELNLTREMPSPGWLCEIESVHVERARIFVEINEVAPQAPASQVMTATRCHVPIGALAPGRYLVELWLRRNGKGEHYPAQALVLLAR